MNRSAVRMISSEWASHCLGRLAPGGDAVAAEDAPIASGWSRWTAAMSRPELEARPAPRHPRDPVAEAVARVSASPSAAVANAIPESG